jgi:hypothetical protein
MRRYGYFIFVYGLPFSTLLIVNIGIAQKLIEAKRRKKRLLGPKKSTASVLSASTANRRPASKSLAAESGLMLEVTPGGASEAGQEDSTAEGASAQPPPPSSAALASRQSMIARRVSRVIIGSMGGGGGGAGKKSSLKLDTRITFMVIAVVVAFFFCQFPYLVVNLMASTHSQVKLWHLSKIGCDFLTALNCCINFIIYCLFGQKFREIAKELLLRPSLMPYSRANMQSSMRHASMSAANRGNVARESVASRVNIYNKALVKTPPNNVSQAEGEGV